MSEREQQDETSQGIYGLEAKENVIVTGVYENIDKDTLNLYSSACIELGIVITRHLELPAFKLR